MTQMIKRAVLVAAALAMLGCSTTPKTENKRADLNDEVDTALNAARRADSSLQAFLDRSAGYAMFPSVGKGGVIAGGAYGRGQVYEKGRMIGYSDLRQGTVGFQLGGQEFSQLIVFETPAALEQFKTGNYTFAANASAVALSAGAAAHTQFTNGVAVFTTVKGGLMYEAAIGGQKFSYEPRQ